MIKLNATDIIKENKEQKNKAVAKLANAFEDAHTQAQALVQNEIS